MAALKVRPCIEYAKSGAIANWCLHVYEDADLDGFVVEDEEEEDEEEVGCHLATGPCAHPAARPRTGTARAAATETPAACQGLYVDVGQSTVK